MKISDKAEEFLEILWEQTEEKRLEHEGMEVLKDQTVVNELLKSGYIRLLNNKISLTDKGKDEGRSIVRRHRLAERLFTDILDIKKKLVHPVSCQFEHLLHEGIDENICILLGHPKTCPHGRTIPEGKCCKSAAEIIGKVITSLNKLKTNQKSRVAYILTKDHQKLQKLMAMGVLPGISITLIQRFPSYVFQIGQSQFAVDKELAEAIFVRIAY